MHELVRDWAAQLVTSGLVILVGVLIRRAVGHVDTSIGMLTSKLETALAKIAEHDTRHALTEQRLTRAENEISMLHSRLSRLITDKLLKEE